MGYTLKELGDPKLASMYSEYLKLSDKLANGEIEQLDALRRVEALEVVDDYNATWKVDPNTGTFVMIDANGVRTVGADPRAFTPSQRTERIDVIPDFEVTPNTSDEPISLQKPKMVLWKKAALAVGALLLIGAVFLAGFVTHNQIAGHAPAAPTQTARPTVDGSGPSAERMQQVFTQLSSGDTAKVKYVVPDEDNPDMVRWAAAVFGSLQSDGYRFKETRTESGVSVLQVIDQSDQVIMQGDLTWTQDAGGTWVLKKIPVMGPVDTTVDVTAPESPAASDAGGSASPSPSDVATTSPSEDKKAADKKAEEEAAKKKAEEDKAKEKKADKSKDKKGDKSKDKKDDKKSKDKKKDK